MSASPYVITGNPGRVEVRQEINDFVKDPLVLNLFLQALARVQVRDKDDRTSYFQIGGIHGRPYKPWDNVVGTKNGYCTHHMVLFPTWHRVYVALIEQVIQDEMRVIAREYYEAAGAKEPTMRSRLCLAAEKFRYPYWDWAKNPELPNILTDDDVEVLLPLRTSPSTMPNPLKSFKFLPEPDPSFKPEEFTVWPETLRCPGTHKDPKKSDISNVQNVNSNLKDEVTIREQHFHIIELMLWVKDWKLMSNRGSTTDQEECKDSLEAIHDRIHVDVGGDGHMAYPGVAGFDPIFFLHHTNVDRFFAFWQYLNPGSKVTPADSGGRGTATIPAHTKVDEDTDLAPFHADDANFWTSVRTYDTKDFGYTYPELGTSDPDPAGQRALRKYILHTYNVANLALHQLLTSKGFSTRVYTQWIVTASVKPGEFPSSGYIHIFLSPHEPSVPASQWLRHQSRVGSIALFVNESPLCDNCNEFRAAGGKIVGGVYLTADLLERGLNIDSTSEVETYLSNNIHWRCVLVNGTELPLSAVPSLVIKVKSGAVHEADPDSDGRERRGPFTLHPQVTRGKIGGFSLPQ